MLCRFVIAQRATWNGRIFGNNLSRVNYTLSYALETTDFVYHHRLVGISWPWIIRAQFWIRQKKRRKTALSALIMVLGIMMTKSLKTSRMTRLRRPVLQRPPPGRRGRGRGELVINSKYPFPKVLRLGFRTLFQEFASVKCIHFRKLTQICFCRSTWVSQVCANMI